MVSIINNNTGRYWNGKDFVYHPQYYNDWTEIWKTIEYLTLKGLDVGYKCYHNEDQYVC